MWNVFDKHTWRYYGNKTLHDRVGKANRIVLDDRRSFSSLAERKLIILARSSSTSTAVWCRVWEINCNEPQRALFVVKKSFHAYALSASFSLANNLAIDSRFQSTFSPISQFLIPANISMERDDNLRKNENCQFTRSLSPQLASRIILFAIKLSCVRDTIERKVENRSRFKLFQL